MTTARLDASYHLWLKPYGVPYRLLAEQIEDLAFRLDAPVFEPHVTLVGDVRGSEEEILRGVERLAQRLEPFEVVLTRPAWGAAYFQCVFLLADPSPPLLAAHEEARRRLGKAPGPYLPHLSLLYGEYSVEVKERVTGDLRLPCPMRCEVDAITLVRADSLRPTDWHEIAELGMVR